MYLLVRLSIAQPAELYTLVAQLVEHLPKVQVVVGLNPTYGSSFFGNITGCMH